MIEQPDFEFDAESTPSALGAHVPARTVMAHMPSDNLEVGKRSPVDLPPSTWREVPQARFLSWTPAEQMAYCAVRDEDSASHEASPTWLRFYIERAESYRDLSKQ